jgi:hypothetical protein
MASAEDRRAAAPEEIWLASAATLLDTAAAIEVLTEMILLASAVALLERTLAIEEMSAPTRLVAAATLLLAAARAELLLASALLRVGAAAARATSTEKVYPVFMMEDVVWVCGFVCVLMVRVVVSALVELGRYLIKRAPRRASYRCPTLVFHGLVPV